MTRHETSNSPHHVSVRTTLAQPAPTMVRKPRRQPGSNHSPSHKSQKLQSRQSTNTRKRTYISRKRSSNACNLSQTLVQPRPCRETSYILKIQKTQQILIQTIYPTHVNTHTSLVNSHRLSSNTQTRKPARYHQSDSDPNHPHLIQCSRQHAPFSLAFPLIQVIIFAPSLPLVPISRRARAFETAL